MTLHVFNPEHDIALAANLENFTAPRAGRQLRHSLGFLPALWAEADSCVLADDVEKAQESLRRISVAAKELLGKDISTDVVWLSSGDHMEDIDAVEPWGWDRALCSHLHRMGVVERALPSDAQLQEIRELSHRRTAAKLLERLQGPEAVPIECHNVGEAEAAIGHFGRAVVKAPWSSSGRGVRFVGSHTAPCTTDKALTGWMRNVVERQGSVMVEPIYNNVKDFGMEFEARADGSVAYCGLSLFSVTNGAYTGNILATERKKRELMDRYVALETIDEVKERLCRHLSSILQGRYCGPLGVDMMVYRDGTDIEKGVDGGRFLVHPCVEINLRRTMGHVALSLTPADDDRIAVMQVSMSALQLRALS